MHRIAEVTADNAFHSDAGKGAGVAVAPNPFIQRKSSGGLRLPAAAAHVEP